MHFQIWRMGFLGNAFINGQENSIRIHSALLNLCFLDKVRYLPLLECEVYLQEQIAWRSELLDSPPDMYFLDFLEFLF